MRAAKTNTDLIVKLIAWKAHISNVKITVLTVLFTLKPEHKQALIVKMIIAVVQTSPFLTSTMQHIRR